MQIKTVKNICSNHTIRWAGYNQPGTTRKVVRGNTVVRNPARVVEKKYKINRLDDYYDYLDGNADYHYDDLRAAREDRHDEDYQTDMEAILCSYLYDWDDSYVSSKIECDFLWKEILWLYPQPACPY